MRPNTALATWWYICDCYILGCWYKPISLTRRSTSCWSGGILTGVFSPGDVISGGGVVMSRYGILLRHKNHADADYFADLLTRNSGPRFCWLSSLIPHYGWPQAAGSRVLTAPHVAVRAAIVELFARRDRCVSEMSFPTSALSPTRRRFKTLRSRRLRRNWMWDFNRRRQAIEARAWSRCPLFAFVSTWRASCVYAVI